MIAIIVIAYNRPMSLKRLLDSICNAQYSEQFHLVVSIDKSDIQEELIEIVRLCAWDKNFLTIIKHDKRLNLKKHVLFCGDFVYKFESIVMLEDDIIVSKYFPEYVIQTLDLYGQEKEIAGISLYSPSVNVETNRPFIPFNNGKGVFLMQFPQSWGQCWNKRMWNDFKEWLQLQNDDIFNSLDIPENVKKWGKQSWLKYQVAYCVLMNKFYLYPYESLSSNCSEAGSHNSFSFNSSYQVPLRSYSINLKKYNIREMVRYDAFFENLSIISTLSFLNEISSKICIDLYGYKKNYKSYDILVTTNQLNIEPIKKIQLTYRPHELNLLYPIHGEGINIYDLSSISNYKVCNLIKNKLPLLNYDLKDYKAKDTLVFSVILMWKYLKSIVSHKFKR